MKKLSKSLNMYKMKKVLVVAATIFLCVSLCLSTSLQVQAVTKEEVKEWLKVVQNQMQESAKQVEQLENAMEEMEASEENTELPLVQENANNKKRPLS